MNEIKLVWFIAKIDGFFFLWSDKNLFDVDPLKSFQLKFIWILIGKIDMFLVKILCVKGFRWFFDDCEILLRKRWKVMVGFSWNYLFVTITRNLNLKNHTNVRTTCEGVKKFSFFQAPFMNDSQTRTNFFFLLAKIHQRNFFPSSILSFSQNPLRIGKQTRVS